MARSDAKLKTLPEDIQAEMWRMRTTPVDAAGQPCAPSEGAAKSQADVLAWLFGVHGVSSSAGAFSEWENWYRLELNMKVAHDAAFQAIEARKRMDPSINSEDLMEHGQLVFSAKALAEDDAKTFARIAALAERRAARLQDARKFDASQKSEIDRGLEALGAFIKGNKEAEAVYAQLRGIIAKATA